VGNSSSSLLLPISSAHGTIHRLCPTHRLVHDRALIELGQESPISDEIDLLGLLLGHRDETRSLLALMS
jgi:hypothetical protein